MLNQKNKQNKFVYMTTLMALSILLFFSNIYNGNSFQVIQGTDTMSFTIDISQGYSSLVFETPILLDYESPTEEVQWALTLYCIDDLGNYNIIYNNQPQLTTWQDVNFPVDALYPINTQGCTGIYGGYLSLQEYDMMTYELIEEFNINFYPEIYFVQGIGETPFPNFAPTFVTPAIIDLYDNIDGEIHFSYQPNLQTYFDELIKLEHTLYFDNEGETILIERHTFDNYDFLNMPFVADNFNNMTYNGNYILEIELYNANTQELGETQTFLLNFNNGINYLSGEPEEPQDNQTEIPNNNNVINDNSIRQTTQELPGMGSDIGGFIGNMGIGVVKFIFSIGLVLGLMSIILLMPKIINNYVKNKRGK